MNDLTTTDLDHVSGGFAAKLAPSPARPGTAAATLPYVATALKPTPPFHGGPVHVPLE